MLVCITRFCCLEGEKKPAVCIAIMFDSKELQCHYIILSFIKLTSLLLVPNPIDMIMKLNNLTDSSSAINVKELY